MLRKLVQLLFVAFFLLAIFLFLPWGLLAVQASHRGWEELAQFLIIVSTASKFVSSLGHALLLQVLGWGAWIAGWISDIDFAHLTGWAGWLFFQLWNIPQGLAVLASAMAVLWAAYPSVRWARHEAEVSRRNQNTEALAIAGMLQTEIDRIAHYANRRITEIANGHIPGRMAAGNVYGRYIERLGLFPPETSQRIITFYHTLQEAELERDEREQSAQAMNGSPGVKQEFRRYYDLLQNIRNRATGAIRAIERFQQERKQELGDEAGY